MKSPDEIFTYIKEQFEIGNYGRVIRHAEQLLPLSDFEHLPAVHVYKALAELNEGQGEKGLATLEEAVAKFPEEPQPRFVKSLTLISRGDLQAARTELRLLADRFPENLDVLNNLIYTEEMLGNPAEILRRCDQILAIAPEDYSVLLTKASAYRKLGRFEEAIESTQQALAAENLSEVELAIGHHNLGLAHAGLKQFTEARTYLEQALQYDADPLTHNDLALVLAQLGEVDEGLELLSRTIQLEHYAGHAYKNRAKIHLLQGDTGAAIEDLETAKELGYEFQFGQEVNRMLAELTNEADGD